MIRAHYYYQQDIESLPAQEQEDSNNSDDIRDFDDQSGDESVDDLSNEPMKVKKALVMAYLTYKLPLLMPRWGN